MQNRMKEIVNHVDKVSPGGLDLPALLPHTPQCQHGHERGGGEVGVGRVMELELTSSPWVGCHRGTDFLRRGVQNGHDKQLSPGSSGAQDSCLPALLRDGARVFFL